MNYKSVKYFWGGLLILFISPLALCAAGDVTMIHGGLSPDEITVNAKIEKSLIVSPSVNYELEDYMIDLKSITSKIAEAKRLGYVIDILKIEKPAGIFSQDVIAVQIRPPTEKEKENSNNYLRELNNKLMAENNRLRSILYKQGSN